MIHCGDNRKVLQQFPDNHFHSVVTDPPYGWSFMGKKWDYDVPTIKQWESVYRVLKPGGHMLVCCGTRTQHRMVVNIEDAGFEIRDVIVWLHGQGFPKSHDISKSIDKHLGVDQIKGKIRSDGRGKWEAKMTREKGGGDTGIGHADGSKQIYQETFAASSEAQHWDGWGTGLKPAAELWTLCRKPINELSIVVNILKHGVGGLNIDDCRIKLEENSRLEKGGSYSGNRTGSNEESLFQSGNGKVEYEKPPGRWPANVILQHHNDCIQTGTKKIKGTSTGNGDAKVGIASDNIPLRRGIFTNRTNEDGTETVEDWNCQPECPVRMLDKQSGTLRARGNKSPTKRQKGSNATACGISQDGLYGPIDAGETGGASRFFYQAKASNQERYFYCKVCDKVDNKKSNHKACIEENSQIVYHPTQKPEALIEYLIKLITPSDGIVLDPYMGSGTLGVVAERLEMKWDGIEIDETYCKIAEHRIKKNTIASLKGFME